MQKRKTQTRILSIDPGTKEMGIAFMDGDALIYHVVKTFKSDRTPRAVLKDVRKSVTRLITYFHPNTLVLERLYYIQQTGSPLLNRVYRELKKIGRNNRIKVVELAPNTIRKTLVDDGRATKLEVARILCHRFPQLSGSLIEERKKKLQQKYWFNMFDAVAAGVAYRKKMEH